MSFVVSQQCVILDCPQVQLSSQKEGSPPSGACHVDTDGPARIPLKKTQRPGKGSRLPLTVPPGGETW